MKKNMATHAAILVIGLAAGFFIAKRFWVASPAAVTIAVANWHSDFGISETNAPLEQLLSLVWQAVENPHRRKWTTKSYSWTEPCGPYCFPETNESVRPFYAIGETNKITQQSPGTYSSKTANGLTVNDQE